MVHTGALCTGLIGTAGQRPGQPGGPIWLARRDPWDPRAKESAVDTGSAGYTSATAEQQSTFV